jgi:hypothetical protein
MIDVGIVGLGWWGNRLIESVQGRSDRIRFVHGVAHRRRDGQRADVRPGVCAAGGDVDGRDDGGLLPVRTRVPGAGGGADHQRVPRDQPGDVRHHEQAAGDDRVGVVATATRLPS